MEKLENHFLILVYLMYGRKHYPHITPCPIEMENRIQIDEVPG